MNKYNTLILIFWLAAGFMSCEDDDCDQLHIDTDMMGIPTVMKGSFPVGAQMVNIGDSIVFAPQLLDTTGVTYSWSVDGRVVSADSSFTFRVEQPCRARLICTLQNAKGKVILESDIASKQDLTKGFFVVQESEIGFYDEGTKKLYADCYQSFNAGAQLMNGGNILVTRVNQRWYVMENSYDIRSDNLTVIDPATLSRENGVNVATGLACFIPLNERYALLSGLDGVYRLDMLTLQKTQLAEETEGLICSGMVYNGKLLVNRTYYDDVKVAYYDVKALIDAREGYLPDATELNITQNRKANFVQTKEGDVYTIGSAGSDLHLVKIRKDFTSEAIALPFSMTKARYWSTMYFPGLATSPTENAIYIPSSDHAVYKYIPGDASSWLVPFVAAPGDGAELSGTGISVNSATGELYVLYSGMIKIFDAAGTLKQTISSEAADPQAILFNN